MPGLSAPTLSPSPSARAPDTRGGLERVAGVDRAWIRVGHRRQQAKHPHGGEDILALGAAAVVAAQRDVDTRTMKIENRSNPALELEIADRVVDHARPGVRDLRDMAGRQPDAVNDAQSLVHQPRARELVDERTGRVQRCRGGLHARLVDVGEDRQAVLRETGRRSPRAARQSTAGDRKELAPMSGVRSGLSPTV